MYKMLQLSNCVKQDYLRFSVQDNANHKYPDARVYFENSLFQHCAKISTYACVIINFACYYFAFYTITNIINPCKLLSFFLL